MLNASLDSSPPSPASRPARLRASPRPVRRRALLACLGLGMGVLLPGGDAASVRRMDLNGLCERADRIVRGVVVDVSPGSIEAGGGQVPTVTYRIKVTEILRGAYARQHDLTMVGDGKEPQAAGQARRFPLFQDMPQLEQGREYLLFTTAPSRLGLCTTVGLGQGRFLITTQSKQSYAVNGFNNAGLGLPGSGPVAYDELASQIRARLNR